MGFLGSSDGKESACNAGVKVLVPQSCPTLCDPMDCSLPGSSVQGISQARILEWVAISFSRGSSWSRDQTWVSCIAGRVFTVWATREAYKPLIQEVIEAYSSAGKESTCNVGRPHFDSWVKMIPWRRKWQPTPVLLPGESQGQRTPAVCSPFIRKSQTRVSD